MKELTKAIFSKLSGSSLETAISGRLFKGRAPQGTDYPYIVFFVVSDIPQSTYTENFEDVIIQFSLFSSASSSSEIEDLFIYLKALYDECAMTIASSTLIWMKRENATLMVEDHTVPPPGSMIQVWHYAVDYMVKTQLS